MRNELAELWRYRELLWTMVERELRIRYKNSVLGILWSFLIPLSITGVLTFVYGYLVNTGIESFSAYILAAYLPFLFFQQSILDSAQSILSHIALVKKIYFPREILVLSVVISNFVHLLLGMVVFFAFLVVMYIRAPGVNPFQPTTIILPLLLVTSFMLATGASFFVATLNTFYEDVKYAVGILLYMLFFLSPITYTSEMVAYSTINQRTGGLLFLLYHLNPVSALATLYRQFLLAPQGPVVDGVKQAPIPLGPQYVLFVVFFSFMFMVVGYAVFNRNKWRFVERP